MDRREFLKASAVTAAFAAVASKLPAQVASQAVGAAKKNDGKPTVAVVRNGEPVAMFRKGIAALGGMSAFVKPGQSVCVKPNIGWDRTPELAANTNPDLVGEIVRQCLAAGASKVEVFDHTCDRWSNCYENSGIQKAVEAAGGQMLPGNDNTWYVEREAPEAVVYKKSRIHKTLLGADVVINVPVLKNHGGAVLTGIMKNWMGVVWDRQWMHHNNMPQCIADSFLYRKPDLNVLDAYRMMVTNGPKGVGAGDVRMPKYLIISKDPVVVDYMGAKLIEADLDSSRADGSKSNFLSRVAYIPLAEKLGLGIADPEKHNVARLEA